MNRFYPLIGDVWREVGRHLSLKESVYSIGDLIRRHVPIGKLVVQRPDLVTGTVFSVTVSLENASVVMETKNLTTTERRMVEQVGQERCAGGDSAMGIGTLNVWPAEHGIRGPLILNGELVGLVDFVPSEGTTFDSLHTNLFATLLEPLAVAIGNDRRIHELKSLRDAAEADRESALVRLGRKDLHTTIIGAERGLKGVMRRVAQVAPLDVPVLVFGETGSGKEVIARAIHEQSQHKNGPFIRVNCGAIPSELIDSELFGHEKGAFTGASSRRRGWFERADGGTLFLDEIGELPMPAQVRFLRVLQEGFFERVGGENAVHVNVRVVAATHRNLVRMVELGEFREDLWYRIAGFPLVLPPLRERLDDVPALAEHFAARAARRFGLKAQMPMPEDIDILLKYHWPGNIRELAAVMDRAAILGDGDGLEIAAALGVFSGPASNYGDAIKENGPAGNLQAGAVDTNRFLPLDTLVRNHIEAALQLSTGRVEGPGGAAALLRVNPNTLRARMRKLHVDWAGFRSGADGTHSRG